MINNIFVGEIFSGRKHPGLRACRLVGLLAVLLAFLLPLKVYSADKIVVQDATGATKFVVKDTGQVGIGTASPSYLLDVNGAATIAGGLGIGTAPPANGVVDTNGLLNGDGTYTYYRQGTWDAQGAKADGGSWGLTLGGIQASQYAKLLFYTNGSERVRIDNAGNVGIGTTSPAYPLQMASGARVTTGGVWTNASSREYKENIKDLTTEEAVETFKELNPVKYNYKADKDDKHVGFIAEDVPDLVATKDRKGLSPMDIVAVLTKVVQEQQKTISALSGEVADLKREVRLKGSIASSSRDMQ